MGHVEVFVLWNVFILVGIGGLVLGTKALSWGHIRVARHGVFKWGFVLAVGVRRKIAAGNYRHMIGVGASVVAIVGEVDVVNASDEPTNPRRPLPGIGFHGPMFKLRNRGELWGEHPMCAFRGFSPAQGAG